MIDPKREHTIQISLSTNTETIREILSLSDGGLAREIAVREILHALLNYLTDYDDREPVKFVKYSRSESKSLIDDFLVRGGAIDDDYMRSAQSLKTEIPVAMAAPLTAPLTSPFTTFGERMMAEAIAEGVRALPGVVPDSVRVTAEKPHEKS